MISLKPGHGNLGYTPERLTIVDSASSWPTDTGHEVRTGDSPKRSMRGQSPHRCRREIHSVTGKSVMHLRPLTQSAGKLGEFKLSGPSDMSELNGYIFVHMPTMVRASLQFCHGRPPGYQRSMHRHLSGTSKVYGTKRGAGMEEVFGCPKCGVKSEKTVLYRSLPQHKPGKNP